MAANEIEKVVDVGTQYVHESGGDPLEISSLTYRDFCSYHKKYYCAANCFVFLYGNIPTQEQLDFLEKNILSKIKRCGHKAVYPKPDPNAKIQGKVQTYGPADGKEKRVRSHASGKYRTEKNPEARWKWNSYSLTIYCGETTEPQSSRTLWLPNWAKILLRKQAHCFLRSPALCAVGFVVLKRRMPEKYAR